MAKVELNAPAPNFKLTDYTGREITLSNYRGKKNVLLVFNRGFTWPFCREHMAQLRQDYDQFVDRDTEILVLGPENADAFRNYFTKHDLPYPGLPDPQHSVLKKYGQEVNLFKLGRMPAQVLVDKNGTARFVHYGKNMTDIPDNAEILELVEEISVPAGA